MIVCQPIGFVRASRSEATDDDWGNVVSNIELTAEFASEALDGLEAFSHAAILYHFISQRKQRSSSAAGIRAAIRPGRKWAFSLNVEKIDPTESERRWWKLSAGTIAH
jgi:tRNA (Thr-GGU) A37 N-methylase